MRNPKTNLRWLATLAAGFGLLAAGCSETGEPVPGVSEAQNLGEEQAGLIAFQSCGELEGYIKEVALAEVEKMGGYWQDGTAPPMAVDVGIEETSSQDSGAMGGEGAGEPNSGSPKDPSPNPATGPSFSETNVQVQGVDEPDLVKTDGNYIYTVHGRTLRILKTLPAADTTLVSELKLPHGNAHEIFLHGDNVLIYGQSWGGQYEVGDSIMVGGGSGGSQGSAGSGSGSVPSTDPAPSAPPEEGGSADSEGDDEPAGKPGAELTQDAVDTLRGNVMVMTFVNVSDKANPDIVRTMALESGYATARMIGSTVYTVARGHLFVPGNYSYGYAVGMTGDVAVGGVAVSEPAEPPPSTEPDTDEGGSEDEPGTETAPEPIPGKADVAEGDDTTSEEFDFEALKAKYKEELDKQSLADWMPKYVDIKDGNTTTSDLAGCGNFYKPTIKMGLNTVTILAIDLANPMSDVNANTTLGSVDVVFASDTAIFASSYVYGYWFWNDVENQNNTEYSHVHRFALNGSAAQYEVSAKVPGRILNQFSMDEHDGHLRVATTQFDWNSNDSTNGVYVLNSSTLAQVGAVEDLALGERIYSARFIGDRGYVVTFKQVDPLFTLDLSNHAAPKVAGELKIPGFSTYIHPLGDNHLLTVGRDGTDEGAVNGLAVQIFDVTDLANPTLAHKAPLGDNSTSSEALYDHRAFSYFPEKGLLALPYQSYGNGGADGPNVTTPTEEGDGGQGTPGSGGGSSEPNEGPDGEPSEGEGDTEPPEGEPTETEPVDGEPTDTDPDEPPDEGVDEPWQPELPEAGMRVFTIDAVAGIAKKGDVSHTDLVEPSSDTWYWRDIRVMRTLMIEGNLYSVGTAGLKVSSGDDLSELAAVPFPEEEYEGGGKDSPPSTTGAPTPATPDNPPEEDQGDSGSAGSDDQP